MSAIYQTKELGKIARFEYGKSQVTVRSLDGLIPVYGTGGLMEYANASLHPGPSVIVGRKGSLGNPIYSDGPFWAVDTTYFAAECDGSMRWLHYVLCSLRLENYNEATGVPSLARPTLNGIRVLHPTSDEQGAIVRALATVDRAIEQTEALLAKQQRIKTGLMHDLLTRGLDAQGRLRDPSTHDFKPSRIGSIPADWTPSTVGFECDQVCVGIVIRPTQYYADQGPIALRSLNVQSGFFDLSNVVRIRSEANEKLSKSRLKAGDVVTVRTGEPGTSAVVTPELEGANCIDLVISRPGRRLRSGFLALWMNSAFGKEHVFQNQGGLAQQHFNVGDMKLLPIPLPDVTEQDAIVARGQAITKAHDELQGTLAKLRRLKSGLMHDLLTGEVSVTPLLSNSAS